MEGCAGVSGAADEDNSTSQTVRESEMDQASSEKPAVAELDGETLEERGPSEEGEKGAEEQQQESVEREEDGGVETRVRDGKRDGAEEEGDSGSGSENSSDDEEEEEGEGEREGGEGELAAGGSRTSQWSSREEKMKKLRELHKRRLDARQLNHREVVEEDRRSKLPTNWESRQRRLEWEEEDDQARQEAEAAGEDYEREKMLKTSAAELERLQKKRKKNPDPGFSDYAQASFRQYERLTKQMKPDMEAYEKQKTEMGADFYPGVNSLVHGGAGKVSKAGIERMTGDLAKQVEKRSKYSRRRAYNPDGDVDYINERNMRFNKKAARYYDKYTAEIKQNLERGTAI